MGLFDGLLGGGGSAADDPYADILTPAQRNQMQVQGLLAMAGAFAQAGMPSRLPVPFGSALGSAAAALGTGQEAGMKTAIENALAAQKVRDLRAKAGILAKLNPLFQQALDEADKPVPAPLPAGPGISLGPPGAGARPGASPTAPAAGGPLMMDLPYAPGGGGGLLGPGDDTGLAGPAGKGIGLLGPGPAATAAPAASPQAALSQDAAAAEVARLDAAYAARNPDASPAAKAAMHTEYVIFVNRPPTERGGSSTAPAEPDAGAGGDTPWGPTFAQQAAARTGPARGETPQMTQLIEQAAAQRGVSPDVLRGLIKTESGFKPNIVSPAGAVGLAQLMPGTARVLGVTDPTDPAQAIPAAAQYLRQGLDAGGGDINQALMYYHGGPNRSMWGLKTQAYPGAVLAAAGGAPPSQDGGGEDAGWGPTFAQGGPDRVIPSGAGGNLPAATLAQYAPGGAAVPGMPQLAPPSTLPPLAAPGAAPALGAGGKIPGLNMTPQKLAIIDAMAEAAGLGNPFKGLLETYYKSPGYLQESAGATEAGKRAVSEPSDLRIQAAKARTDLLQQLAKDGLTLDANGAPVEIPGMQKLLGKSAGEIEAAKERAKAQFQPVDATVLGPNGEQTTEKMTAYEFSYRRQQAAARGGTPQPGDIIGTPNLNETQKAFAPIIAKAYGEQREAAVSAAQQIKTNNESLRLLDKGLYTGWDANLGLALGRVFGVSGRDPADQVKNTQLFVLQRMQQAAQAVRAQPGSASDKDVAFANRMSVGDITLNADTIREGLEIYNKFNLEKIREHNRDAVNLPSSVTGGIRQTIDEPPVYERRQGNTPGGNTWTRP